MGHDFVEYFGGGDDTRNTCSGVGSGANEVEAIKVFALVVWSKPCALTNPGFEAKSSTLEGVQAILKV
jgi:hypothetical protein